MNRILALDLGTKCGWAFIEGGHVEAGRWILQTPSQRTYESPGMRFIRLRRFIKDLGPELIAVEEVRRHRGTAAAHIYGGLKGAVEVYCEEDGCEMLAVPVGTIKKHATGKGNASKDAMVEAAVRAFGVPEDISDDEADARWILDYVIKHGAGAL